MAIDISLLATTFLAEPTSVELSFLGTTFLVSDEAFIPPTPPEPTPTVTTTRCWTATLDGHDFYFLRVGDVETLVYDEHSQQWYVWGSGDTDLWNVKDGINWIGGNDLATGHGSNIVVGSDTTGTLFFLNPEGLDDASADVGSEETETFLREISAEYPVRGYNLTPCYGLELFGSVGDVPEVSAIDPTNVTLEVSDNRGNTYTDCGTVSVPVQSYDTRVMWRSLGSMKGPGRLFRISDYGALHRIDYLEMMGGREDE